MVDKKTLYAVITGDVVKSSKYKDNQNRAELLSALRFSFSNIDERFPGSVHSSFDIYRGDEFQGVMLNPEFSLCAAIIIRTTLQYGFEIEQHRVPLDARIVIGIGPIDFLPARGTEGEGKAFRDSGPILDEMKGYQRLLVRTPWSEINQELDTECALLDAVINKWSPEQAQATLLRIRGLNQTEIAKKLKISQPAVRSRLIGAGSRAIESFLERFEQIIRQNISVRTYSEKL